MAEFQFTRQETDTTDPVTVSYHKKEVYERFYERNNPYFLFSETINGLVTVSDLSPAERLVMTEALASGADAGGYTERNCVNLPGMELLEALRAIEEGESFTTPVRMSRAQKYPAPSRRRIPRNIKLPSLDNNSLEGNLKLVQLKKTDQLKEIIANPDVQFSGLTTNERSNLLLAHGLIAGALAMQLSAELDAAVASISDLTPTSVAERFCELPGIVESY
ncbi:hypothetical protein KBD20_04740 [Candidatus Saccharibacteria bacterium]|nr:hypothetical protein [Candidatus Saccharibacteria bacterium]